MRHPHPATDRRHFLKAIGATVLSSFAPPVLGAVGANEQVRLGLIGCGDRAKELMKLFSAVPMTRFVAVSDPDTERMDRIIKGRERDIGKFVDYRKMLERPDIDAVVVASPNHWHALHTIHACQAGKDVYVEKPVTFSLDQGSVMLEAARKHGRLVQAGTQSRSDTGLTPAVEFIRSGALGRIKAIRGLCYRNRSSIGKLEKPLTPPKSVDYNLWLGGAEDLPILRPRFHYDWHWDFNTGNGDIGNQGPHEFDMISRFLGEPVFEGSLRSIGNRFGWNDAGKTPNLQMCWFELAGVPVIFEVNNLWQRPDLNASPAYKGLRVGVIVTCEGGEFIGGTGGGYVLAPDGKTKIRKFPGDGGAKHQANFIDAIRSRDAKALNAPLEHSVKSSALPHIANLSHRTGEAVPRSRLLEQVPDAVAEVIRRNENQLAAWSIDTEKTPYILGSEVRVAGAYRIEAPASAAGIATPHYRGDFGMPRPA